MGAKNTEDVVKDNNRSRNRSSKKHHRSHNKKRKHKERGTPVVVSIGRRPSFGNIFAGAFKNVYQWIEERSNESVFLQKIQEMGF